LWECAFLSLSELDELLQLVKQRSGHSCIYPMFVFAAHTGARRSELIRSTLDDLDFDHSLITIHERKKSHDKRTTRRVPMSALLRAVLQDMLQRHPGIHSTFWHEPPIRGQHCVEAKSLDADTAHGHFKRTLAGSKWEKLRGWHIFRHSFCSNCAAKGIDQRIIDAWVGNLSPEMVRRYRHLLPDQQRTAINIVFGNGVQR
jgi:integrase